MKTENLKLLKKSIISMLIVIFIFGTLLIRLSFSFEIKGDKFIKIKYHEKYHDKGAKITVFFQDFSKDIQVEDSVDTRMIGKYKVKYSYNWGIFPFTKTRNVEVVDEEKPTIQLTGQETVKLCPKKEYEEEGYSASDEYDGDLTEKVEILKQEDSIKYKVVDSSGNAAVAERKLIRKDEDAPKIWLSSGNTIYLKQGSDYEEFGYTAMDNCDGDLTDKVKVEGTVDSSTIGTYEIKYKVKDSSGNQTEVIRKVIVNESKSSESTGKPGVIYLTFDDGPSGFGSTEKILDVLKEEGVKATFFVTSSGPDSLIKREFEEGHTVALHTYTHDYKNVYASVENYFNDLAKIQERVKTITGKTSTVIRFPGGSNNTISNKYHSGIMDVLKKEVENRGFIYFDWNVDASDAWQCARDKVTDKRLCVYRNVTNNLSKEKANVVLMHDIKSYTADAIKDIIRYGKEHGYVFEALDENTAQVKFH